MKSGKMKCFIYKGEKMGLSKYITLAIGKCPEKKCCWYTKNITFRKNCILDDYHTTACLDGNFDFFQEQGSISL